MVRKLPERPTNCPNCKEALLAVEYSFRSPEHYDGVSEYACPDREFCGYRIGRWTGEIIPRGYCESRYGTKGVVPVAFKKEGRR